MVFSGNILQIYATMDGIPAWVPLTNPRQSYVHQQAVAKADWLVEHGLSSDHLMYDAYDANGDIMLVSKSDIDNNIFKLSFAEPTSGYVIVFSDTQLTGASSNIIAHLENRLSELDLPNIIKYEETDNDTGQVSVIYDFNSFAVAS